MIARLLKTRISGQVSQLRAGLRDPVRRRRLIDEGAVLVSRAVAVLGSVVTGAVTARVLGPELRGDYFYGVATGLILAQLSCLGIPSANAYFSARSPERIRAMVIATLVLAIVMCGAVTAGFLGLVHLPGFARWRVSIDGWLLFALGASAMLATTIPVLLAGLQRYVAMSMAQIGGTLASLAMVLTAAWLFPSIAAFTFAVLLGALLLSVIMLAMIATELKAGPWLDRNFLRDWLVFSGRAMPSLILGYLLARGTVYSARSSLGAAEFGVFTIAYQIFEALIILPQTIAMVLFPKIARSGDFRVRALNSECLRAAVLCTGFGMAGIAAIMPLIPVVFGAEYAQSAFILAWYFPALVAYAVVAISNQFLAAMHFPTTTTLTWAVCAVVTVGFAYTGGRMFSGVGVAIGTSLGWVAAAVVFLLVARYEIGQRGRALRSGPASGSQGVE